MQLLTSRSLIIILITTWRLKKINISPYVSNKEDLRYIFYRAGLSVISQALAFFSIRLLSLSEANSLIFLSPM